MKFHSFCLLLLLTTYTFNFAEGLWGSGKSDQQQAKDHGHKAAEDVRQSAKYARDAASETAEAAKAQGRAFTGGARQKAQDYYDSAGNLISNMKDYSGTVYNKAGKSLGDAKDYVYDTAAEYYDKSGNLIDDMRHYVGNVYDKAGNSLGDAKDFAYEQAHDYYDSAGELVSDLKDFVGTVYDRAGNALGDAKDYVFDSAAGARRRASNYYDKAGNLIDDLKGYAGVVYDRSGKALGDAKDYIYDKSSDAGSLAGEKLHRAGDYFGNGGHTPCRRLLSDSCDCIKSFFPSFFSLLLALAALLAASYFIYTRLLGRKISVKGVKRQGRQLGDTIKAKAGVARERVNDLGHCAKETIDSKLNRTNGRAAGNEGDEQTHEYNLRNRVHYSDNNGDATDSGHSEESGEVIEGEEEVLTKTN